jgi:hypothetical protein
MKLDKIKQIFLIIFIVANIYNVQTLRKFSVFQNISSISEVDSFLSRGFSYLILNKEINQFPESPISPKKIFNYDSNILKNILPNFLYSDERYRFVINRNVTNLKIDEMKKNAQITVGGEFLPTVNSGQYKQAISHIYRRGLADQLTTDNYGIRYLTPNHDKNFPSLSNEIMKDAYKKFKSYPNSVQSNGTFSDFINDDNLIQGAIDFFKDFGTHYITEYTLGYRAGFNREYRTNKTFLINKDGKVPNINLNTILSFIEKSLKIETVKKVEKKKETTIMKNFLKKDDHMNLKQNPAPLPILSKKPNPDVPNSPQNEFDANDPNKSIDDDSIFSSSHDKNNFNSIIKNSLTSLGNSTFLNLSRYNFIVDEPAKVSIQNDPLFAHFSVGECETENYFIKSNRCNKNNPRLIRYKIAQIHRLFNPFFQTKSLFKADNLKIGTQDMIIIHDNLRRMSHFIQEAMDPSLFVITEIFSNSFERNQPGTWDPCLKTNPSTFETIRQKYMITKKNQVFKKEALLMNKLIPVVSIKNYATPKKTFDIISNTEKSLYWCLKQEHNIHPEDLKDGEWRKRRFVIDIRLIIENDHIPFTNAGYECKETWEFTDTKTKNLTRWHFCVKYSNDFINPILITDVKIFEFQKDMGKCFHDSLVVWNNGRKYYCNCELNLQSISDDKNQKDKDVFFCYSRKNDLYYKPIIPNRPFNSKNKFAKKTN